METYVSLEIGESCRANFRPGIFDASPTDGLTMTSSEEVVIGQIREVFANKGQTSPPLGPETALDLSLGLESLDFAELAIRLEQAFGKDPFASSVPSVATVADLAALYER